MTPIQLPGRQGGLRNYITRTDVTYGDFVSLTDLLHSLLSIPTNNFPVQDDLLWISCWTLEIMLLADRITAASNGC
jgi:hypothetical protein